MSYPPNPYAEDTHDTTSIPLINGTGVEGYPVASSSPGPSSPAFLDKEEIEEVEIDLIRRYEDFTTVGSCPRSFLQIFYQNHARHEVDT
jgi:hypothetical protein